MIDLSLESRGNFEISQTGEGCLRTSMLGGAFSGKLLSLIGEGEGSVCISFEVTKIRRIILERLPKCVQTAAVAAVIL